MAKKRSEEDNIGAAPAGTAAAANGPWVPQITFQERSLKTTH
jgi:hypothetical protein